MLTLSRIGAALATGLLLLLSSAQADPAAPETAPPQARELLVGTKEAPPFSMKSSDGTWEGISIDLWRRIAKDRDWRYRIVEAASVQDLLDGVAHGPFDIALGALTVTAERERALDFTTTFFSTGLGIAIPASGGTRWTPIINALTSFGFLQAVLALIGLALAVGLIVWILERRHNEEFGGGVTRGLSSSVWWTTVAMTQRGIGNFGPRTLPGRAVAMLWMVGSIIAIAVFTAGITSALTVRQLQGSVHSVADLSMVKVGTVGGTTADATLTQMKITAKTFANAREGLLALRAGKIDAFVYDKPLLAWTISHEFHSSVLLIDTVFDPQHYAFAVAANSPLRKPVGIAMLEAIHSPWWDEMLFRYGYR